MSEALTDPTPAVTQPGSCERIVSVGPTEFTVKYAWTLHKRGVKLTTTVCDAKRDSKASNKRTDFADNTEAALSLKGTEMTNYVLKNKRDWYQRKQQQQHQQPDDDEGGDAGCGSGGAGSVHRSVTCPIISALRSGEDAAKRACSVQAKAPQAGPPAGQEGKPDWTHFPAPPLALLAKMKSMSTDKLLDFLAAEGVQAAADIRTSFAEQERQGHSARNMKKAVANAKLGKHTEEGRRQYETLLTASVHGRGDDPSSEPSAKRTADFLDVPEMDIRAALKRAKRLDPDLDPEEALKNDVYWFESPVDGSDTNCGETRG